MKSRINNLHLNKSGLCIALIFLCVGFINAQSSYPITDPRNPNCPCHKYQKLADEEFKKLLEQNNSVKDQPVVIASNKNVGIKNDNEVNQNDHTGISDDGMNKKKETTDLNDELMGNLNENISTPIGKTNNGPGELDGSEQKIARSGSAERSPKYTTSKHWKGKRKKHTSFHKQMKRIFYVGGWDIWKGKRITSACYHWR